MYRVNFGGERTIYSSTKNIEVKHGHLQNEDVSFTCFWLSFSIELCFGKAEKVKSEMFIQQE